MNIRSICLILFFLMSSYQSCAAQLKNIQLKKQADSDVLLFTLSGKTTPKVFQLTKPNRLVVDLPHTQLAFKLKHDLIKHPNIDKIRSGYSKTGRLRLVFETKDVIHFQTKSWKPPQRRYNGFCIDIGDKNSTRKEKQTVYRSPEKKLRDVIVVIDAGHGGKDPGAKGPRGTLEKDIVLAIALKLKRLIDKQPGMKAELTRKGDYYIGLRERLKLTREYDGDIFVAIHADAFINKQSNGASVFALSQTGATSEAARWLAEKENYSELGGVDLSELDDKNGVVRSVLIDLSQTATIGASLQMGHHVLKQLDRITRLHNNKVEQARFVVLKSPDIPSVLIETGFISNPREERNLKNSQYQRRLSMAIYKGLKNYFWEKPPHGTFIEAMTEKNVHVVRSGETLSGIAAKYNIDLQKLLKVNRISKANHLNVGQKLVIPWA